MKRIVCFTIAVLLGGSALAAAAPAGVCAAIDAADKPMPTSRVVIDPATKLPIRIEQPAKGTLIISVTDKNASVRKEFQPGQSVTTIRAGARQLVIALRGAEITVTDRAGSRRGSLSAPSELATTFGDDFGKSAVVRAGRDLLDRLALQGDTVEGNALLLTRALLAASTGEISSVRQHQQWARWKVTQPKVVRVLGIGGPGECWDKYASEAIRIFDDFTDCLDACRWYSLFCGEGCDAMYILRAEFAFLWYFNCNGPFYG